MKSVICFARGEAKDAFKIEERPTPEPGAGEVRVRVHMSGVNPSDFKVRNGSQGPMPASELVPHCDGSGIIEAVGEGVLERRIGERVWLYNVNRTEDGVGQGVRGTAAEQIIVDEKYAAPLPHGISYETAACLGVPAMTAHRLIFAEGPVKDKWVLVTGGAGSVGLTAVQMASAAGAKVIATVSSDEKAKIAIAAGAVATINYRSENTPEAVLKITDGTRIDRIIDVDFAANVNDAPSYLIQGGIIAQYGTSDPSPTLDYRAHLLNNIVIRSVLVYAMSDEAKADAISDINQFLRDGVIQPIIHKVFPIEQVAKAHEEVEAGGYVGNTILAI